MTRLSDAPPLRLLVCVGPRCDATGRGRALYDALKSAMDAAQLERVSLQTRDCLRLCCGVPVVRVEPSGDVVADPTVEDLLRLVGAAPERGCA